MSTRALATTPGSISSQGRAGAWVDAGCYASGAALGCVATMAARRIHYYLSIKSIPGF